jgi:hypothetical protein
MSRNPTSINTFLIGAYNIPRIILKKGMIDMNDYAAYRNPQYRQLQRPTPCADSISPLPSNYTVAMLEDVFNNTIVVVLNNQTKQYSLAMCQPTPSSDKDLELNTFYGEKGNILALYYFKGKTSVKKRINLLSKKIY